MPRETLTIQIGQCGNQIAHALWTQLCAEHGIGHDGHLLEGGAHSDDRKEIFFYEADDGHYVPRSILLDLEPRVLQAIQSSTLGGLYNMENVFNPTDGSGAGNNWSVGYSRGMQYADEIGEMIQREVENSDNLEGITLLHSIAGGTGSGMGSYVLELVADYFSEKLISTYSVMPNLSRGESDTVVQPYNSMLALRRLAELADECVVIDNTALHAIAVESLKYDNASFDVINALVSRVMTASTATLRFPGPTYNDRSSIVAQMVPLPYQHFLLTGYTPLTPAIVEGGDVAHISGEDFHGSQQSLASAVSSLPRAASTPMKAGAPTKIIQKTSAYDVLRRLLQPKCLMASTSTGASATSFTARRNEAKSIRSDNDVYVAMMAMLQGDVRNTEVNKSVQRLRENKMIKFAPGIPNVPSVVITRMSPHVRQQHRVSGLLLANHTSVSQLLKRTQAQYEQLRHRGAFLQRYEEQQQEVTGDMDEANQVVSRVIECYESSRQGR